MIQGWASQSVHEGSNTCSGGYCFTNAFNRAQNLRRSSGRPGGRVGKVMGTPSLTGRTAQKEVHNFHPTPRS